MKKHVFFIIAIAVLCNAYGQTIVSTVPQNKKVMLEEFTGTGCPNCPGGHTTAASILSSNPGVVYVIAYHPNNSTYTSSDPMATAFPAAFYSNPWISPSSRFMPSAVVNRRVFGSERILPTSLWAAKVNELKAESSPLNVGVATSYNSGNSTLTVDIEIYFTANVTNNLTLYAVLLEDGIVASQSGGSASYVHNHVFRVALPQPSPAQWGEPIAAPTTMGTLKTVNYTFDNSTTNFDMANCDVVVFVRDASNEEIISGNGVKVGSSTVAIQEISCDYSCNIFPNPIGDNSMLYLTLTSPSHIKYEIFNVVGQVVHSADLGMLDQGNHSISLSEINIQSGLYFLTVNNGEETQTLRIVKQ